MRAFGVTLMGTAFFVLTLFGATSASATVLCKNTADPCVTTYENGTTFKANLRQGTEFVFQLPSFTVECSESAMTGEVTNAGGVGTVSGSFVSVTFGKCNCPITALNNGTFEIHSNGSGNGAMTTSGTELTVECKGIHCIARTSSTYFSSLEGGAMATETVDIKMPRSGGRSGASCGSTWPLTAEYTVTAPEPLYVAEKSSTVPSTVLCKTQTSPCAGEFYGQGTTVEAHLKTGSSSVLHPIIGEVTCSKVTLIGEVTKAGGPGEKVSGRINSLDFEACNGILHVLLQGAFTIESSKEGNGTFKLAGLKTTVEAFGFHCVFSGTAAFTITGGEMASLASSAALSATGGRSGAFCGSSASWTGEYTVTAPAPLYVEGI